MEVAMKAIKNVAKVFLMVMALSTALNVPVAQASLSGAGARVKKSDYSVAYKWGWALFGGLLVVAYEWIREEGLFAQLQKSAQLRQKNAQLTLVMALLRRILDNQGTVSLREFRRQLPALPLRAKNECTRMFLDFRRSRNMQEFLNLNNYFTAALYNTNPVEPDSHEDIMQDANYQIEAREHY